MTIIYKISDTQTWQNAKQEGSFNGSPDDIRDGYIHFSTLEQLEETLNKHYKGQTDLLLIAIEGEKLGTALKWEPSRGGALFPHLYAPLPTDSVLWEKPIEQQADGKHIVPTK